MQAGERINAGMPGEQCKIRYTRKKSRALESCNTLPALRGDEGPARICGQAFQAELVITRACNDISVTQTDPCGMSLTATLHLRCPTGLPLQGAARSLVPCTHTSAVQSGAVVADTKVPTKSAKGKAAKDPAVARTGIHRPRLLTSQLTRCNSIAEVVQICCNSEGHLNPIHVSAALNRCVQLVQQHQQQALQQQRKLPTPKQPQQLQHVKHQPQLHAAAPGVGYSSQQQADQLQQLHRFVAWALQQMLQEPHLCSSREISTALWCCAKLRYSPEPGILSQLLSRFLDVLSGSSCQAMSMVLYSLAKLGYAPGQTWLDQLLYRMFKSVVTSQQSVRKGMVNHACGALGQQALQQQDQEQLPQQSVYNKQDGAQQHPPLSMQQQGQYQYSSLRQQQQCKQQQQLDSSIGQVLSNTIWALARLEQQAVAEVWLLPLLSLLCTQQQGLHTGAQVGMQSTANVLWACSRLISTRAAAAAGQQASCFGSALLQQHWQQELGISWGGRQQRTGHQAALLAAVRLKAATLLESCKHQLHTAQPQELTMLVHSCSVLELNPSMQWQQQFWAVSAAALQSRPSRWNMHECVSMLFGVAYLRLQPTAAWFAAVLSALQPMLVVASADQLSKVVWAVGTLRARPPVDWMSAVVQEFISQLQQQPGSVPPTAVSMLVWGASKIGYQLPSAGMEVLMRAVADDIASYGPHQLSKLLHGCSTLRMRLPHSWWTSVLSAFNEQLQNSSAADVTMALRTVAGLQVQQGRQQELGTLMQHQQQQQQWASSEQHSSTASRQAATALAAASSRASEGEQMHYITASPHGSSRSSVNVQLQYCESSQINALLARAEQLLGHMTAVELCQALYAAAKVNTTLNPLAWSQAVNYTLPRQMHLLAPGDVCLLLYSLAQLQHALQPRRPLHKQLLLHSYRMMTAGRFKPQDLTALVWNYFRVYQGRLSAKQQQWVPPRQWVTAFTQAAGTQLHEFTGRQLGVTLKGLLLFGVIVDKQFLDMVSAVVDMRSASYSKYELAMVSSLLLQLQQAQLQLARRSAYCHEQQHETLPRAAAAYTAARSTATTAAAMEQEPLIMTALQNAIVPMRAVTAIVDVAGYSAESLVQAVPAAARGGTSSGRAAAVRGRKVAVIARAGRV